MKRTTIILPIIILAVAAVAFWLLMKQSPPAPEQPVASLQQSGEYYTCPMHPQIHKDRPGACPICGMTLVKHSEAAAMTAQEERSLEAVALSPAKQVLADVETDTVMVMPLNKELRAVGSIEYAEPNLRRISTRYAGRIERLYVTYTGQFIRKGDPVAEVYSPDAISAQQEYLLANDGYEQARDEAGVISGPAKTLFDESREKLLRWGFTEGQIARLDSSRKVQNTLVVYSPISGTVMKKNVDPQQYTSAGENLYDVADLSTVWLAIDIYEYEVKNIAVGQTVTASSDAYPEGVFTGKISFVAQTVDQAARTVRVRADLANPGGLLKPGMYLTSRIQIPLPPAPVVPSSAVISTGNRQVVWVQRQPGMFEPRVVRTGETSNGYTQILGGVNNGEIVVTSGGYLIDSESQLSAMSDRK